MHNKENRKYSPEEILQILIDQYNFQANFDPNVDKGYKLTFATTITEWVSICDLLEPNKLAVAYHDFFELKTDQSELVELLSKNITLRVFCDYISLNANKVIIRPTLSLGSECMEASIFKIVKSKLNKKGIDTKGFKPSTEFAPFFDKHSSELLDIISKLAPGTLAYYKFKENLITKLGAWSLLFAIMVLIISWIFSWGMWISLLFFGIAFLLLLVGKKIKPAKYEISGYNTIRDLIIGMKSKLEMR